MEPLNFLGGKYQQGTQILPGTLQTFRAVDTTTGREVFVHRAPSNDPAAHQLALLLSSALVRSAKARRLVLDVVEESGFAYVVTETEHQCLLLREWLQFEINQTGVSDVAPRTVDLRQGPVEAISPQPAQQPAPKRNGAPLAPESVASGQQEVKHEPGEFTRMFMTGVSAAPAPVPAASSTPAASPLEDTQPSLPSFDIPAVPEAPKPAPATSEPGEFTKIFMAGTVAAKQEGRPAVPAEALPAAPKTASETGEFTRFFQTPKGLERKAPSEMPRSTDRPSNPDFARTGFVQRPGTPIPPSPPAPRSTEPGEFTRMFAQDSLSPAPPAPSLPQPTKGNAPDPFASPGGGGLFSEAVSNIPTPAAKPIGEYTRIFGSEAQGPPVQQPSAVAAPPPPISDDPLFRDSGPAPAAPPAPAPRGPSEYTLVISGGRPPEPALTNAPVPPAPGPAPGAGGSGVPMPKVDVKFTPPPNPLQGLHVPPPPSALAGGSGASLASPAGSASAQVAAPHLPAVKPPPMNMKAPALKPPAPPPIAAPQTNNKLVLLFIILGVLAVLLIVLIVLLLKK